VGAEAEQAVGAEARRAGVPGGRGCAQRPRVQA